MGDTPETAMGRGLSHTDLEIDESETIDEMFNDDVTDAELEDAELEASEAMNKMFESYGDVDGDAVSLAEMTKLKMERIKEARVAKARIVRKKRNKLARKARRKNRK